MVEMWEIEWNSSMIQHGADLGTMEFIFAKGGTLRDFNYVLLNQEDDTWEPLIKAVAERDNSHPDIIRKQAEQQQPFFMQQGQRPAQQFMGTGVDSPRAANRMFNTAQRMENLSNYHQNPSAMNAMRAGKYGAAMGRGIMEGGRKTKDFAMNTALPAAQRAGAATAAGARRAGAATKDFAQNTAMPAMRAGARRAGEGLQAAGQGIAAGAGKARNYLSQKFPGVKQRMGQFMQGAKNVGREALDFARHGIDARYGVKDATGQRQGGTRARKVMQQGDQNELDRLQGAEQRDIDRQRQRATQLATPQIRQAEADKANERQSLIDEKQKGLQARMKRRAPALGLGGFREQVRRLGEKRRAANQPETALDPAIFDAAAPVEGQMEAGPAEAAMADSTAPLVDDLVEDEPSTEMPTPEAPNPQPVDDLVEEEAPPMSRGQELAMNALRAAKYSGAENDPSKYRGSTQTQYKNVGAMDFDNMSYEDLQGNFKPHISKQKAMFEYLVNELGLSPAEAAKEVETTEVEVPNQVDDLVEDDQILLSAERVEVKGWDALLKQLDVR